MVRKRRQAATMIQSTWRMVVERRRFLEMVRQRKHMAAITLQRKWRTVVERRREAEKGGKRKEEREDKELEAMRAGALGGGELVALQPQQLGEPDK